MTLEYSTGPDQKETIEYRKFDKRVSKTGADYEDFVNEFRGKEFLMGYVRYESKSMFLLLISPNVKSDLFRLQRKKGFFPFCMQRNVSR